MKFLEKLVDKIEPNFEKGGKYEKWFPLFDGFATFLFTPKHTTKNISNIIKTNLVLVTYRATYRIQLSGH